MIGYISAAVVVVTFLEFTVNGAEVYLIDASAKNGNVHRLTLSIDKKSLELDPLTKDYSRNLFDNFFEIHKYPGSKLKQLAKQNRVYGYIFDNPANFKSYYVKKVPSHAKNSQVKKLEPIMKYLLGHKSVANKFEDLTRKEKPFAEDYVDFENFGRIQTEPDFSQDYIDFRMLRNLPKIQMRKATNIKKQALRSYQDSDESDDDDSKSKRFEVVKNINNKKDINNDSDDDDEASDADQYKEKTKNKNDEIDSDEEFSELSDKDAAPKKITRQSKKKKESDEDVDNNKDEEVELYLQGNKLTMYPPMTADSSEETRRMGRRNRMPYFMPKRFHWTEKDIPNLGYFFFNGPKGSSQYSD